MALSFALIPPDPALKLGQKQYGQCGLCGARDYESQTAPKRNSQGEAVYKTVQRTSYEIRVRGGKKVRVPVAQQPKRVPVRVRMCQNCLLAGGYKKRPLLSTYGITRFETFRRCRERFWKEPFLPTSDAMEQGSADHAVFNWFNTKGNETFKRAVLAYKPGVSNSPLFHQQGPMGLVAQILSDNRFTKIRESASDRRLWELLDHSLLSLKRLVKFGVIRLRSEWFGTRYGRLRLDAVSSEFVVEATLSEVEEYYKYKPKRLRSMDVRFRGSVDFNLYFAGNHRKFSVYVDWKGYRPTDGEKQALASSPQLRWYVLVDAMRHGISPKRLRSWTKMDLVFNTPDWHEIVPVEWQAGDPHALLDELNEFVLTLESEKRERVRDVPETERVVRHFPPTRSSLCEKCPVRQHNLCSYWDPSAAKVPLEDLRHQYPISTEEIRIKF